MARTIAVMICMVCLSTIAGATGQPVQQLYKQHKEVIHTGGVHVIGQVAFSYATAGQRTEHAHSLQAAVAKATLRARAGFAGLVESRIDFPADMSPAMRQLILAAYQQAAGVSFKLTGSQVIDSGPVGNQQYYAVVAVSLSGIEGQLPDYAMIQQQLQQTLAKSPEKLPVQLRFEWAPTDQLDALIPALGKSLVSSHGPVVGAVVAGQPVSVIGTGWSTGLPEPGTWSTVDLDTWWQLLAARPYDPQVCDGLSAKLLSDGFARLGRLVAARGAGVPLDAQANARCLKRVDTPWSRRWLVKVEPLPQPVADAVVKAAVDAGRTWGTGCELIIGSQGRMPWVTASPAPGQLAKAGQVYFAQPPRLSEALDLLVAAANQKPNAEVCNLIGACLRRSKTPVLAIPFLQQAITMEPQMVYAHVNLARVYHQFNQPTLALKQAQQAGKAGPLDAWSQKELAKAGLLEAARAGQKQIERETTTGDLEMLIGQ